MPDDETKEQAHPLDKQNALERAIQLEGSKDPDNFKMPDGRSLGDVRRANEEIHYEEFLEESKMIARRTREVSIPEFSKGKDLVMTRAGSLIDVTPSPVNKDTVTMATSRTTSAEIDAGVLKAPSAFEAPKSMEPMGGFSTPSTGRSTIPPTTDPRTIADSPTSGSRSSTESEKGGAT